MNERAAPPRKVADCFFPDFVRDVALGPRMLELELHKTRDVSDGEEEDSEEEARQRLDAATNIGNEFVPAGDGY